MYGKKKNEQGESFPLWNYRIFLLQKCLWSILAATYVSDSSSFSSIEVKNILENSIKNAFKGWNETPQIKTCKTDWKLFSAATLTSAETIF